MLESHGASRMLVSFNDIIPGFVFAGLFFSDEYLEKNPQTVRAFLAGLTRAFDFIKQNEKKARQWIPKYAHVELEVAMKSALREFDDGREAPCRLEQQIALMKKYGYLKEEVPLSRFIDYGYLPEKK